MKPAAAAACPPYMGAERSRWTFLLLFPRAAAVVVVIVVVVVVVVVAVVVILLLPPFRSGATSRLNVGVDERHVEANAAPATPRPGIIQRFWASSHQEVPSLHR